MKRDLLFLCGFAVFCFTVLGRENVLTTTSAQQAGIELSLAPLPVPNNASPTRIRSASNDGKRLAFESTNNYTGGNGDGNGELYLYDVNSLSVIQITNTRNYTDSSGIVINVSNTQPIISGNGTRIVFVSNAPALDPAFPNPNGNYDLYIADIAIGATTAVVTRVTNTGRERSDENLREIFTTISPSINDDGNRIVFVAGRQIFNAVNGFPAFNADNADLENDIFIADLTAGARRYSQVTVSRRIDRPPSFILGGFNINPKLSGNGEMLAFFSDYNYDNNRNTEFDPELFIYRIADGTFRQVTVTKSLSPGNYNAVIPVLNLSTGTFTIDTTAGMQVLDPFSKPLSRDGMRFVFESSADLNGGNPNRARQLWVYDFNSNTTTRITNQSVSAVPTQDELSRVDHTFTPSFNSAGTFITFNSSLNLTSANPDGSKEIFRYETNNASFRQLTFTAPSSVFPDQRRNITSSFSSDNGDIVSFNYLTQSLLPNAQNVIGLFQTILRPITSANNVGSAIGNAASFNTNQIARGSLAVSLGTQIAGAVSSASLPFVLNGVSVRVGRVAARITSIVGGRVTFLIPNEIASGVIDYSINDNGVQYTGNVVVVDAAPGIFTVDGSGTGGSTAYCYSIYRNGAGVYSDLPCAASNNDATNFLVIEGTGWRNSPGGTQVKINGVTLNSSFSGTTGSLSKDQINVLIPSNLAGLQSADLSVVIPGTGLESNRVSISFQGPPTNPSILEGSDGVDCVSSTPGQPDIYSKPPCAVSNGSTTRLLVLYGTGWRNAPNLQVRFEELILTPSYSGPLGNSPVIDQMNIPLPATLAGRTGQISVIIPGTAVESNRVPISFRPLP